METHVKVIAGLYIVLGIIGVLLALLVGLVIAGGGLISQDDVAIIATGITAVVIGGLILFSSLPGIVAGFGLLAFKNWARILALILAIFNLPLFPIGTALGIYTLLIMLDDETSRLFTAR